MAATDDLTEAGGLLRGDEAPIHPSGRNVTPRPLTWGFAGVGGGT